MLKLFKDKLFLLFISAAVLWTFWNLPNTFYQQDEWQTLGHNLANGFEIFKNSNPIMLFFGELRPLSGLMYSIFLGFYKFTVVPTAIFAISFQIVNSLLLFYLTDKITKNRLIAFLSSLFLIVSSVSHQAVTWVSAVGTLPAATFILVAVIMYLKYFEKPKKKYLAIGLLSIILSLLFKGVGLFLFILLPMIFFIFQKKAINKKNLIEVFKINFWLFIFGLTMIFVRSGQFFLRTGSVAGYANASGNSSILPTIILHSILYPLTSLFQVFIPPSDFYPPMSDIARFQYKFLVGSPIVDLVAQSAVSDMIAILGSIFILGFLLFIVHKSKSEITGRNIVFALVFFLLSFLPYVFLDRDSSYLSLRYFYVGTIAAGIIFGYAVYFLSRITYLKWVALFLAALFLFHHASIVRSDINYQVNLGNQRKAVLSGIKNLYPKPEKNSIFYVTSDKQYYGDITNPFQNGLGYVLEVWYYDSGNIPKDFLTGNFLWDLGAEGYKKGGDFGFGYFQNMDKMVAEMKKNKLSPNIVHGFFINSSENTVTDITSDVRNKISTFSAVLK